MKLSNRETAAILAGLRLYQRALISMPQAIEDIAADGGKFESMDADEIDALCERVNVEHGPCSLVLIGRRWFDSKAGNTYFSASAVLDGERIAHVPFAYGYGDHWRDVILNHVENGSHLPPRNKGEFAREWAKRCGFVLVETCADVARKRDL